MASVIPSKRVMIVVLMACLASVIPSKRVMSVVLVACLWPA